MTAPAREASVQPTNFAEALRATEELAPPLNELVRHGLVAAGSYLTTLSVVLDGPPDFMAFSKLLRAVYESKTHTNDAQPVPFHQVLAGNLPMITLQSVEREFDRIVARLGADAMTHRSDSRRALQEAPPRVQELVLAALSIEFRDVLREADLDEALLRGARKAGVKVTRKTKPPFEKSGSFLVHLQVLLHAFQPLALLERLARNEPPTEWI